MKNYIGITKFSDLETMIADSKRVLVFKHSTRCPISSNALLEYEKFLESDPDLVCAYVDVIKDRVVSNQIEAYSKIEHESPQIILFYEAKVKWSASHADITKASILRAVLAG